MNRMNKYFRWKNKEIEKEKIEEVIDYFNKLIKPINFISLFTGGLYLLFYIVQIRYLPSLSLENIIVISLTYFILGFIISIIVSLLTILPSIFIYEILIKDDKLILSLIKGIKTNKNTINLIKKNKKVLFSFVINIIMAIILTIPFLFISGLFYLILYFYNTLDNFKESMAILKLLMIILFIINYIYLKIKIDNKKEEKFMFITYLLIATQFFLIINLSAPIAKLLNIGNYHATLYIINTQLCQNLNLKINKQNICILDKKNTKILWSFGKKYLIEVNNNRYKIPEKFILPESVPISKNNPYNNNSQKINKNEQKRKLNTSKNKG